MCPFLDVLGVLVMGSQFHNIGDVCTAMKQFSTSTSQSTSKGSFATQDMLTTFSEALTSICMEVQNMRNELDDVKTQLRIYKEHSAEPTPSPTTASAAEAS